MLFFVMCFFTVVYFVAPDGISGGTGMHPRLLLYPYFMMILCFGVHLYSKIMKRNIIIVSICISLIFLGMHFKTYAELNPYIKKHLVNMNLIKMNSTLLPICFSVKGRSSVGEQLSQRVRPFLHLSSYIAAQRGVVEFNNYQACTDYFPIKYKENLNLDNFIAESRIEDIPHDIDFMSYNKKTEGNIDYVLIWGLSDTLLTHDRTKSIMMQLNEGYEMIFKTPDTGLMQLYRKIDY
jgi:hypothetical protein